MSRPCTTCGNRFMWLQRQHITSEHPNNRIEVDVFRCQGCGFLFIVDKMSKNPNIKQTKGLPEYKPTIHKNTHDEEIFYGIMYINTKGKRGSKPKDYVSTKPYTIGGKIYPAIRKARVRGKKK